jgi:hypothetical protein
MSSTSSAVSASDLQQPVPSYAVTDPASPFGSLNTPFYGSSQLQSFPPTGYTTSPTTPYTQLGSNVLSPSPHFQNQEPSTQNPFAEIQRLSGLVQNLSSRVKDLETENSNLRSNRATAGHSERRAGVVTKRVASQELSDSSEDNSFPTLPSLRRLGKRRAYDPGHDVGGSGQPSLTLFEESTDLDNDLISWKAVDADPNPGNEYDVRRGGNI